jgi:hypothetical protein
VQAAEEAEQQQGKPDLAKDIRPSHGKHNRAAALTMTELAGGGGQGRGGHTSVHQLTERALP